MIEDYPEKSGSHLNYSIITELIEQGASVLDLGCGDGNLLKMLKNKKIRACGLEINQDSVIKALEKGLSVIQGDIDEGLQEYPDKFYDYVILNQTLQSAEKPDYVIKEMLRVGKKVVVSFPNFAYWKVRLSLLFKGKMPKSKMLPFEWYDTPNIHLLTIKDFYDFAQMNKINIEKTIGLTKAKIRKRVFPESFDNFFAEEAIFVISKE